MRTNPEQQLIEMYEAFHNEIFRFALSQTRSRDQALDITQEVFIKTWDYLRGNKIIDHSRAFLYRTCRNLIIDSRRKKQSSSLDTLLETTETPQGLTESPHDAITDLMDARISLQKLDTIPAHHLEILTMRFIQELTLTELAVIYKESENAISVKIHRALKYARSHLAS